MSANVWSPATASIMTGGLCKLFQTLPQRCISFASPWNMHLCIIVSTKYHNNIWFLDVNINGAELTGLCQHACDLAQVGLKMVSAWSHHGTWYVAPWYYIGLMLVSTWHRHGLSGTRELLAWWICFELAQVGLKRPHIGLTMEHAWWSNNFNLVSKMSQLGLNLVSTLTKMNGLCEGACKSWFKAVTKRSQLDLHLDQNGLERFRMVQSGLNLDLTLDQNGLERLRWPKMVSTRIPPWITMD